jgi:hypothetical protein
MERHRHRVADDATVNTATPGPALNAMFTNYANDGTQTSLAGAPEGGYRQVDYAWADPATSSLYAFYKDYANPTRTGLPRHRPPRGSPRSPCRACQSSHLPGCRCSRTRCGALWCSTRRTTSTSTCTQEPDHGGNLTWTAIPGCWYFVQTSSDSGQTWTRPIDSSTIPRHDQQLPSRVPDDRHQLRVPRVRHRA